MSHLNSGLSYPETVNPTTFLKSQPLSQPFSQQTNRSCVHNLVNHSTEQSVNRSFNHRVNYSVVRRHTWFSKPRCAQRWGVFICNLLINTKSILNTPILSQYFIIQYKVNLKVIKSILNDPICKVSPPPKLLLILSAGPG